MEGRDGLTRSTQAPRGLDGAREPLSPCAGARVPEARVPAGASERWVERLCVWVSVCVRCRALGMWQRASGVGLVMVNNQVRTATGSISGRVSGTSATEPGAGATGKAARQYPTSDQQPR